MIPTTAFSSVASKYQTTYVNLFRNTEQKRNYLDT